MDKIKVACYIRVSSLEQANNGFGKDLQLTKIKKYIEYYSDKGFVFDENLVYKDLWISWSKDEDERPWLKKLKDDIDKWKIDVLIVWRLDRIARKTLILLELIEFFKLHNVNFISTDENVDIKTPTWSFFITVIGALAEMERKLIAEKTALWKIEWVNKWFFSMGWKPSFGFIKNTKTRKLEVNEEETKIVKDIFDMYVNQNKSLWEISNILTAKNLWNWEATKVSRIISNQAYIWIYHLNKTQIIDYFEENEATWKKVKKQKTIEKDKKDWKFLEVETIIVPEIFQKAQEKLETNKYKFNNNNKPVINHIFAGLLKCGCCNSNYKGDKGKPDKDWILKPYYRCWRTNAYKYWLDSCCNNSQIRESELIENIYWVINKILKNPNNVIEEYINSKNNSNNSQKYKDEVIENDKILSKNYSKIDELFENLIDEENINLKAMIQNKIDWYKNKIKDLETRNIELKELIEEEEFLEENKQDILNFINTLHENDIYKLTRENQILLLHKIIKKIVINENKVDVYFKFAMSDNKNFRHKKISENKFSLTALSKMVGQAGFEPATFALKGRCSTGWATNPCI